MFNGAGANITYGISNKATDKYRDTVSEKPRRLSRRVSTDRRVSDDAWNLTSMAVPLACRTCQSKE